MAGSLDHVVTDAPADLVSALSLTVGQAYSIQNVDPRDRVFVRIATAAPARTDRANVIPPYQFGYPTADAGEGIYVWTDLGRTAAIVVNQA
ncbi:MAG: hypothetical protein OXC08_06585 [Thiotrichales bacterium]|nr:hypothetical protein [Thiotrichales bacterium]